MDANGPLLPYVLICPRTSVSGDHFLTTLTHLQAQKSHYQSNRLLFNFKNMEEAKIHNATILKVYDYDIARAIATQHNTQISFGFEFFPVNELEPLLTDHPRWCTLKQILLHGATFPLWAISQKHRTMDLHCHHSQGNHKSMIKHKEMLDKAFMEDITTGFTLPLPIDLVHLVPNVSSAPLRCIEQETINERGECIPKYQMTHSLPIISLPILFFC
jgi:hypothetical protein